MINEQDAKRIARLVLANEDAKAHTHVPADIIGDLAAATLTLTSANGHHWSVTMSDAGAIVITDLGV